MIQKRLSIDVIFDRKHLATPSTAANPSPGLIQIRCRYDGKYIYIAVASVYADQFGRKIKGRYFGDTVHGRPDAEQINDAITLQRRNILEEFNRCQRIGITFDLSKIDPKLSTVDKRDFLGWCEERVKTSDKREGTKNAQLNAVAVLRHFGRIKTFDDLTPTNIDAFDRWMIVRPKHRGEGTYSALYRRIIHNHIHSFIRTAINLEIIVDDPYDKFKKPNGKVKPREILTEQEVEMLKGYTAEELNRPSYALVYLMTRDLFLVQCYTGLSYSDLMTTDWAAAQREGIIRATRKKTNVSFTIKLLPQVIDIMNSLNWKVPKIQISTYDKRLDYMAKCVGITKRVSSHIGRHTFATTFGLKLGVPIEVISMILGHSDITTTQIYAKVMESQVIEAFDNIADKIK